MDERTMQQLVDPKSEIQKGESGETSSRPELLTRTRTGTFNVKYNRYYNE